MDLHKTAMAISRQVHEPGPRVEKILLPFVVRLAQLPEKEILKFRKKYLLKVQFDEILPRD